MKENMSGKHTSVFRSCAQIVCLLNEARPLIIFPMLVKTTLSSTWLTYHIKAIIKLTLFSLT